MVKQLKRNGFPDGVSDRPTGRLALKKQLGAVSVGDRRAASRSQLCWPTGGGTFLVSHNVGNIRKIRLRIRVFERFI